MWVCICTYLSFYNYFQILPAAKEYTTSKRNGCVKLRKEESGLGSEEPVSIPTLLEDAATAYPDVSRFEITTCTSMVHIFESFQFSSN